MFVVSFSRALLPFESQKTHFERRAWKHLPEYQGCVRKRPPCRLCRGHQSYRTSFVSVSGAESLISLRTRVWRAFRQSGQRQSGKREGRDPLAERGRLEVIKCPTMGYDRAWYGAAFLKERRDTVQTWSTDLDAYWKQGHAAGNSSCILWNSCSSITTGTESFSETSWPRCFTWL